nr:hypothetical protein DO63_5966 [Burkholderia pseudomallei]
MPGPRRFRRGPPAGPRGASARQRGLQRAVRAEHREHDDSRGLGIARIARHHVMRAGRLVPRLARCVSARRLAFELRHHAALRDIREDRARVRVRIGRRPRRVRHGHHLRVVARRFGERLREHRPHLAHVVAMRAARHAEERRGERRRADSCNACGRARCGRRPSCSVGRHVRAHAGSLRNDTAKRFQPLIVTMASVRSTSSASVKCGRTASQTASGT